jgi:hypothetical protein
MWCWVCHTQMQAAGLALERTILGGPWNFPRWHRISRKTGVSAHSALHKL